MAQVLGCSGSWQLWIWGCHYQYWKTLLCILQVYSSGTVLLLLAVLVPYGLWHSYPLICIHFCSVLLCYICSVRLFLLDIYFLDVMALAHNYNSVSSWITPFLVGGTFHLLPSLWLAFRLGSSSLSMEFVDCCLTCVDTKLCSHVAQLAWHGLYILSNFNGLVEYYLNLSQCTWSMPVWAEVQLQLYLRVVIHRLLQGSCTAHTGWWPC